MKKLGVVLMLTPNSLYICLHFPCIILCCLGQWVVDYPPTSETHFTQTLFLFSLCRRISRLSRMVENGVVRVANFFLNTERSVFSNKIRICQVAQNCPSLCAKTPQLILLFFCLLATTASIKPKDSFGK